MKDNRVSHGATFLSNSTPAVPPVRNDRDNEINVPCDVRVEEKEKEEEKKKEITATVFENKKKKKNSKNR